MYPRFIVSIKKIKESFFNGVVALVLFFDYINIFIRYRMRVVDLG